MDSINTINKFLDFTGEPKKYSPMFYRGQANKDWGLVPSLFRIESDLKVLVGGTKWGEIENDILSKFKRESLPFMKEKPNGYFDWLTIAQHHGLPTRLLDWTTNPLVALFFAVESLSENDAAVYQAYQGIRVDVENINSGDFDGKLSDAVFVFPNHYAHRVNVQQACFSFHKIPKKNDDFIPNDVRITGSSEKLKKVIVPADKKFYFKRELDKLGVNYFSLFPDLDGLSRKIIWEFERDRKI
jgi:hypothetical protein